jgi:hypothetical protein
MPRRAEARDILAGNESRKVFSTEASRELICDHRTDWRCGYLTLRERLAPEGRDEEEVAGASCPPSWRGGTRFSRCIEQLAKLAHPEPMTSSALEAVADVSPSKAATETSTPDAGRFNDQ